MIDYREFAPKKRETCTAVKLVSRLHRLPSPVAVYKSGVVSVGSQIKGKSVGRGGDREPPGTDTMERSFRLRCYMVLGFDAVMYWCLSFFAIVANSFLLLLWILIRKEYVSLQ